MLEIRVEFDRAPILAMCDALTAPGFQEVAALALNATVADGEGETTQLLKGMGLPAQNVDEALSTAPARPEHLEAQLVGGGKAIPMIKFSVRASRQTGVTLQLGKKTEVYRHAFIATVKHGHVGVFERKGAARLPIRELYGPSVHGMMARTDVLPRIADYLNAQLLENLARQIDRRIRRDTGQLGGA